MTIGTIDTIDHKNIDRPRIKNRSLGSIATAK